MCKDTQTVGKVEVGGCCVIDSGISGIQKDALVMHTLHATSDRKVLQRRSSIQVLYQEEIKKMKELYVV